MFVKFNYLSKNKKKKAKRHIKFELEYNTSKSELFLELVTILFTNTQFLCFVTKVVKHIMNRLFYYFYNNSFFIYKGANL